MAFIQPCFIRKNTPELRKKLEILGYNQHPSYIENEQYLYLNRGFYHIDVIGYSEEIERMIDCGDNEELFLALAALRDDSNDYQWFIWQDEVDEGDSWRQYIPGEKWQEWWWFEVKKATPEEIIEHFKKAMEE